MRTNDIDISEESQRVLSAGDLNQAAQRELVVRWQRGFETLSGEDAMEIAFDAHAFAITSVRNS
jgi:hypothetical protein